MVYARWYSEKPTTFAIARACKKGELKKFDTLVKARKYGVEMTENSGGVVMIYSRDTDKHLYAINSPLENPHFMGYVQYSKGMGWWYWNIPDKVLLNREVVFRRRPIFKNGKMAGRF